MSRCCYATGQKGICSLRSLSRRDEQGKNLSYSIAMENEDRHKIGATSVYEATPVLAFFIRKFDFTAGEGKPCINFLWYHGFNPQCSRQNFPGHGQWTIGCFDGGADMSQAAVMAGADSHFSVARGLGDNSRKPCIEPFSDTAKGVMIVRICADASVRPYAVPHFPYRGRAVFYHVEPPGTFCLKQQFVGDIGMTGFSEYVEQQVDA